MKNNINSNALQPKIAAIYARYFCDRQNEQSIDGQLRACKEFADRNNITIVNTCIDKAISGTHDNRDSFQQMLKDSDKKNGIFCLSTSLTAFLETNMKWLCTAKDLQIMVSKLFPLWRIFQIVQKAFCLKVYLKV